MNVGIVSTFDGGGGAARAAYRLHKGLNKIGVNSCMLVKEKRAQDERVLQITPRLDDDSSLAIATLQKITNDYIGNNRSDISNGLFSLGYPGYNLASTRILAEADLINLHWVDRFQSVESILSILEMGKPVVWTLHDQNPFTGGCHYSAGCALYAQECQACPQLRNDPYKITYHNLRNKINLMQDQKITVVSPSQWLAGLANQSAVFRNSQVVTIPNSVETDVFVPQNKGDAKQELGIAESTFTILTAVSGWLPSRKGLAAFLSSMERCKTNRDFKHMVNENRVRLLCFGNPAEELKHLGIPLTSFGDVTSDKKLCSIFSAADVFILPSIEDNLPNTMLESMACGTPVIAFDTGGIVDVIKDGVNGKLVPFCDAGKFAEAILDLMFNAPQRALMGQRARELIETDYTLEVQAQNYAELFIALLPENSSNSNPIAIQENPVCHLDLSFNKMLLPLYQKYSID